MSSSVLVTGGGGFIGSHVVDELVGEGHEVRVLDALLPAAHTSHPGYLNPDAEYVWGDLRDLEVARRCVRGIDAVCHQASMVGLGVDFRDVSRYVSHNDFGTAVLLEALDAARFRGRLVLASSMVVYGEGSYACPKHGAVRAAPRTPEMLEAGRFDPPCPRCGALLEPHAIDEDAPADPRNVYAATKLHQEHLFFSFAREHGLCCTALRYHNVYGPRMPRNTPYAGVASIFRSSIEEGREPEVFEDGRQIRDFVHVTDVACANRLALCEESSATGAFNIASGDPRSIGEVALALCDALEPGARPKITGSYRLGDVRHVFASPERARRVLGFEARVTFDEGMREFATSPLRAPAGGSPASSTAPAAVSRATMKT